MTRLARYAALGFAVFMGLFHLYVGFRGTIDPWSLRAIHLSLGFAVAFLTVPIKKGRGIGPWDVALACLGVISGLYIIVNMDALIERAGMPTKWDVALGLVTIFLVLEMARRVLGLALPVVAFAFLLYAYFGAHLPGLLAHRGYDVERLASHMYTTLEGIFGVPIGVSASYVILFVIFGAFLEATKVGDFYINLANSVAGKSVGGPAKVAVVASGFFGTISGSAVANVVSTGTYTIPLMKRTGYQPHFAGATEAVASSGGQLMPPVMGAAAFVISEMTGISYIRVCAAALIPALLYYFTVFSSIHLEARRIGLRGLSEEEVPDIRQVLKTQGYMVLPAAVLVYLLAVKLYSPAYSAFWAIVTAIVISFLKKETRLDLKGFFKALESGAVNALSVVAACACAGIVVGVITLTGLGLKFSGLILSLAHGNLYLTMALTMVAALILGMGLPTTAAYIICAILAVPALKNLGVAVLAAHLFVFYFAIISAITPPVALAAYAGAAIAQSDPMKTGITACKLGLAAFIVPYMFVLDQSLLMQGEVLQILYHGFTAALGCFFLSTATIGYLKGELKVWERALNLCGALLMIHPGAVTDLVGAALLGVVTARRFLLGWEGRKAAKTR